MLFSTFFRHNERVRFAVRMFALCQKLQKLVSQLISQRDASGDWILILGLPLTGCVTLQKSLSCSEHQLLKICKERGTLLALKSVNCWDNTLDSENASSFNPQVIWKMLSVLKNPL